eukprot:3957575-Amphidinium_carterae.1
MLCWLMSWLWLIFSNDNVLVEAEVVELVVGEDAKSHGLMHVMIAPMVVAMRNIAWLVWRTTASPSTCLARGGPGAT